MGTDAFAEFDTEDFKTEKPTGTIVPNQFPKIPPSTYRLAIIGEAPGKDEEIQRIPFIGASGWNLDKWLNRSGLIRACCFVGNICQQRPPGNDISKFDFNGPEITAGLGVLATDLQSYNPNLCLLLGKTALYAAKGVKDISNWRGTVFISDQPGPFFGRKCLASYHPAFCLRSYDAVPFLLFDIARASKESRFPQLVSPKRDLIIDPTLDDILYELTKIQTTKPLLALDIEGGVNSLSCISVATSDKRSFIIPFERLNRDSYWSAREEATIWGRLASVLADPSIGKCWQNGLYDRFVLQQSYNIVVRGNKDDTLLKHWELYCELEKALSVQTSLHTDEPYYKSDRKTDSQETFYRYCCKDSAVTYEINSKLGSYLTPLQSAHYQFNHDCLNFLLYSELRGIRYDQDEADKRLEKIEGEIYRTQEALDLVAEGLNAIKRIDFSTTHATLLQVVQAQVCYKKNPSQPKKGEEEEYYWAAVRLNEETPLTSEERSRISILCGMTLNMRSHKKFHDFLYITCGLPTQWKKDPKTKEMKRTANYEALLKLSKDHTHPALGHSLMMSLLLTRGKMLSIHSQKGRMHCSYNLVGSETGRVTSSKSILPSTGKKRVGYNLQTIPDDWEVFDEDHPVRQGMRDLFLADEGCYLFKCDLKGADGWTVGAYLASLGDPTMLDDLKFGIKPPQVVAFILKHGTAAYHAVAHDRKLLKETIQCISKDMWEYFVSKQGFYGSCYLMGPKLLSERVFIESEGKIRLTESQARDFQSCITIRYRVKTLHDHMAAQIERHPYPFQLASSVGFTRKFFGRKKEILGEVLAHLPQAYTTYATLKAAHNLWTDRENRSGNGTNLQIEILHQVHDELLMQARIEDTSWAIGKIKSYFSNEIMIANQRITIPFDGAYGTNWAMNEEGKKGSI